MMTTHQQNITRLRAVNNALGELKNEVVFVGGATVSLYADRKTGEARPTDDVDVVIELWAHKDYARVDERLRNAGFVNDQESGVICRYIIDGIVVDVMPTHDNTLGFSNRWYPAGFKNAINYNLGETARSEFSQLLILSRQNLKHLKTAVEMMDGRVQTLKTLFLYWKTTA